MLYCVQRLVSETAPTSEQGRMLLTRVSVPCVSTREVLPARWRCGALTPQFRRRCVHDRRRAVEGGAECNPPRACMLENNSFVEVASLLNLTIRGCYYCFFLLVTMQSASSVYGRDA